MATINKLVTEILKIGKKDLSSLTWVTYTEASGITPRR